ncbi:hypothetical protein [Bartonella raoultii]|uniref:hypothetical protein n=1 Tax=Bartonella raoultii TaxID=1457020 RepID=UPI001FE60F9A|nr:hypothetical protein [Bartonella raoultii]
MQTVVQIGAFLEVTIPQEITSKMDYNGLISAICILEIIISLIAGYSIFRDKYSKDSAMCTTPSATEKELTP